MIQIYVYVLATTFYSSNSVNYCDSMTETCKCSATKEACTGKNICNQEGTCEGKHKR